jgi:diguanylate cyclase (GGDEF)-like protein
MSAIGSSMMSTPSRPMLVRAGLGVEHLRIIAEEFKADDIQVVETLFDALCETGSANQGTPISAILMAPPPSGLDEQAVVDAFRRTAPDVRMIMLLPSEDAERAPRALAAGFNEALTLPTSLDRLQQAIDPRYEKVVRPTDANDVEETSPDQRPAGTERPRSIVEIVLEEACSRLEQETSASPEIEEPLLGEFSTMGDIGDTDLIRALIEGRHIENIAIEMIRTRTGIDSIELLLEKERPAGDSEGGTPRPGWTCVSIGTAEESFGFLASDRADESTLTPWSRWLRHWLILQHRHADFRRKAWTDELTGAGNRRALDQVLGQVITRARDARRAVTVMFFDIDNFKTYNDRFGHDAGDKVLRETVQLLRSVIRRGDHVFRVGGDEFVVIFAPDPAGPRSACSSPPESIEQIASRFQHQVCSLQLPQIGLNAPGTLSISAGMATYPWDGREPDALLRMADELALESKRSGKNVITFGPAAGKDPDGDFPRPPHAGTDEDAPGPEE